MSTLPTPKYQVSAARLNNTDGMTVFEQMRLATDVLKQEAKAVSYTHLTLPTIYSV